MSPRIVPVAEARELTKAATPGPWIRGGTPRAGEVFFGTLTDPDDHTEPGILLGSTGTSEDAALIAAAPDLAHTAAVLGDQREAALALHTGDHWCAADSDTAPPPAPWGEGMGPCPTARALGVTE